MNDPNAFLCSFRDRDKDYFVTDCAFADGPQAARYINTVVRSLATIAVGRVIERATGQILYEREKEQPAPDVVHLIVQFQSIEALIYTLTAEALPPGYTLCSPGLHAHVSIIDLIRASLHATHCLQKVWYYKGTVYADFGSSPTTEAQLPSQQTYN